MYRRADGKRPQIPHSSVSSRVHAACATDVVKSCMAHYQSSPTYTQLLTLTLCPFKQQSFKVTSRSALDLVVTHRRMSCITSVITLPSQPTDPQPNSSFPQMLGLASKPRTFEKDVPSPGANHLLPRPMAQRAEPRMNFWLYLQPQLGTLIQ